MAAEELPEGSAAAPALARLQAGDVVDGFVLGQRLHQGGMASLWDVRRVDAGADAELPLLMKVPRIRGGEDPASIVGFEVECMLMPMLSGPHVPRFVAKGDFTTRPYIVMERVEGASLAAQFEDLPMPVETVIEIGSRVAEALHALHRQHVVHLDVKPANILQRPDGRMVMVDFGLARHEHLPDLLSEQFEVPLGSAPYMSPEQVQYVRSDPRSDVFALGAMLYEATTGRRPFGTPTSVPGLRRRLYDDPVPPRKLRADCPGWLQETILRCLEVQPDRRYQSAAQLALALQAPDQIPLGERAARKATRGGIARIKRWLRAVGGTADAAEAVGATLRRNPIIVAAVDTEGSTPELLDALVEATRRLVGAEPGARLACVNVMRVPRIAMDDKLDAQGRSLHVKRLVHLKHWARPIGQALGLDDGRLTYHVIEAPDAASALLDFARRNHADHIVTGARGGSALRRYLGSVSSQIVSATDCTVTVVRAPQSAATRSEPERAPSTGR